MIHRGLFGCTAGRYLTWLALTLLCSSRALAQSAPYSQTNYDYPVQAHRQPGSLFKVFVYLTALSNGYRPDSPVIDQPVQIEQAAEGNGTTAEQGRSGRSDRHSPAAQQGRQIR